MKTYNVFSQDGILKNTHIWEKDHAVTLANECKGFVLEYEWAVIKSRQIFNAEVK